MIEMPNPKRGYAMLELLFYVAFFAVLSIVVINAMISMTASFRESRIYAETLRSGNVMERITREIRQADSISTIAGSTLKLNTRDEDGIAMTVQFSLSGADAQFFRNDALVGNLNAPDISVTGLSFAEITTTEGKAVKIVLTVASDNDPSARSVDFYDTVGLRGSY